MRDINELVGIIRGINFDGVVNDKEVARLQDWVDRNRNLVYDKRQVELINSIDSILEDHIIDDNEREMLISMADSLMIQLGDNSGKIHELYGIVDGIVCDGIVNADEVEHFRVWIEMNQSYINSLNNGKEILRIIDQLLQSKNISIDAHNEILVSLSKAIKITQFESRLEYICNQIRKRQNIGMDIIDFLDNEDVIHDIHSRAEAELVEALTSSNGVARNPTIIVVSLVLIAMLEYDGNYYDHVRDVYTRAYELKSEQMVEGKIRSILYRYIDSSELSSRSRIISVVLEHAVVPKKYLKAFFDFIFDIYKINFDYDLPSDLYEDFKFVYEGLLNNMIMDSDDLEINVTHKTYKLIVTTKQLMTNQVGLDALIKLSILIVRLIDKRYWNKDIKIYNPYLKEGFEGWASQLKDINEQESRTTKNALELKSRWEPKFVLDKDSGVVKLVAPSHRIKSQYDYQTLRIEVFNGEERIYSDNNFYIKNIIGGYQIEPQTIQIDNPFDKITYKLYAGEEELYSSKKKLHRSFVVFDEQGKEINNNTDYEGIVYVCSRSPEQNIELIQNNETYVIGYKNVRIGELLTLGEELFSFSAMVKPGVFGDVLENTYITDDKQTYSVFKEVKYLSFEADKTSDKFEIIINGKHTKLSDYKYKVADRVSTIKYMVDFGLSDSDIYSIEVNQLTSGKKNRIYVGKVAYDPHLEYCVTQKKDEKVEIIINTGLAKELLYEEVSLHDFEMDSISFKNRGIRYYYSLPLDLGIIKINEGEWKRVDEDIWIDDVPIGSNLMICDSKCDGLIVYSESGALLENNIKVADKGNYKIIPIGFLNSYKTNNNFVTLVYMQEGRPRYISRCYYSCVMDKNLTEIEYVEDIDQVVVKPVFHGNNKVYFKISKTDFTSKQLSSGEIRYIKGLKSFTEYTFSFYEKKSKLSLTGDSLLCAIKFRYYSKDGFIRKVFKITEVYYNQKIFGRFIEINQKIKNHYVAITGTIDDDFLGLVFTRDKKGNIEQLATINPVRIEKCSDVIDSTIDAYITNLDDGGGLLFNINESQIMDTLDDRRAPPIFLYTLLLEDLR